MACMVAVSIARLRLACALCVLALGCGDGDAPPGSLPTGNRAASDGGSSAGESTTGGGSSAGERDASGGRAGMGGLAIDATGGEPVGRASNRQTPRPIGSLDGNEAGYWEYLPPHYGNGELYPLLVFRHGYGQNGNGTTDLPKVLKHGPPMLIATDQWPEDRKFVVLSVQHASGCPPAQETDDFLAFALGHYDIDPKRVYFTGLSCGANGGWSYLGEHTDEVVTAAVLIAGDGRPAFANAGCNLGKLAIWAFCGEADPVVNPQGSIATIKSLQACTDPPAVDARLTTYPGVGHNSWTMTYDLSNPAYDIYAWMMTHSKP